VVKGRGDHNVRFTFKRIYYPLSLWERGSRRQVYLQKNLLPPLPLGEGWGEGCIDSFTQNIYIDTQQVLRSDILKVNGIPVNSIILN